MPVLYIDKPKGITSFKLCKILSKYLNTTKIGHTGTLDPNATGLMVILYDNATKANQFLVTDTKEYIGVCKLGILTDTLDIDGEILRQECLKMPNFDELQATFNTFVGTYKQMPPMTSAIKVNGKKLIDYKREGKEVKVEPRDVTIYDFKLLSIDSSDEFTFKCKVSSGTYVRTLLRDALDKLMLFGTLKELKRTKIDDIDVLLANSVEDVEKGEYKTYSLYDILSMRYYTYISNKVKDIKDGKPLTLDLKDSLIFIVDEFNNPLAIYEKGLDGKYYSKRGLF